MAQCSISNMIMRKIIKFKHLFFSIIRLFCGGEIIQLACPIKISSIKIYNVSLISNCARVHFPWLLERDAKNPALGVSERESSNSSECTTRLAVGETIPRGMRVGVRKHHSITRKSKRKITKRKKNTSEEQEESVCGRRFRQKLADQSI